ncbi:MAG TPA: hypothetical protein ENN45_01425, partial [Bacteroidetes bacterium]|nr:hypothetical protein [Bacteroidota bacterium]
MNRSCHIRHKINIVIVLYDTTSIEITIYTLNNSLIELSNSGKDSSSCHDSGAVYNSVSSENVLFDVPRNGDVFI